MSKPLTFKDLVNGSVLWTIDPTDRKIKKIPVKSVMKTPDDPGYVDITIFKVATDIALKTYDSMDEVPIQLIKRIRQDDTSAIVIFPSKNVAGHLPVPIFISKGELKTWLNQSNTKIIQTTPKQ